MFKHARSFLSLLLLVAAPPLHAQANLSETLIKVNAEADGHVFEGYWRFVRISAEGTHGQTFGCPIPPPTLPETSTVDENWSVGSCTVDFGPGYAGRVEFQLYAPRSNIRLDIGGRPYISFAEPSDASTTITILSKYSFGELTIRAAAHPPEPDGS